MKTSVNFIWFIGIIWIMAVGCSKDDPSGFSGKCKGGEAWFELVSDENSTLINASTAYSADPSKKNCEDLKSAYRVYIKALKDISKCVAGPATDAYKASLKSAEQEIDNICQ